MKYRLLLKRGRVVDAAAGLDGPLDVGRLYRKMIMCADGKGGGQGEGEGQAQGDDCERGGGSWHLYLRLQPGCDKVMDALRRTIDSAKKYGKFVIFGAKYPYWEDAQRLRDMGVQAIEIGYDVSILGTIWKRTVQEMRRDTRKEGRRSPKERGMVPLLSGVLV